MIPNRKRVLKKDEDEIVPEMEDLFNADSWRQSYHIDNHKIASFFWQ